MEVLLDTCGPRTVQCLLLLYLLVATAAADCPAPQGGGNVVLTDEALLMNDFPEGSVVTLECANGYVQDGGTHTITCAGQTWTEQQLNCTKVDCGPPNPQPNMSFNASAGTLFGAVVRVICDKGYQVRGANYKLCYATGWSGRAKCEIVTCKTPAEVANGGNSWDVQDVPKYGEIIQYTCNEGHTLVGKDSIVCSETGEYDSQPPECKGVTTDDRFTTKMVTPTPTSPAQEASTSADSSAAPTAHRDKPSTTSATPAVSPSEQGGRDSLTAADKATTTSVTSATTSLFQGMHDGTVDTNKDIGHLPVIISVIVVFLAVCIVVMFIHRFLLRRKGSAHGMAPIC